MNELLWYNQGIHSGLMTNQDKNNRISLRILHHNFYSTNMSIRISSTVLNNPILNPKIRMRCLMLMILKWYYVFEIYSIIQPYGDCKS